MEPAEARQPNVQWQDAQTAGFRSFQNLLSTLALASDFNLRHCREQPAQAPARQQLVIGNQDSELLHQPDPPGAGPLIGSAISTTVLSAAPAMVKRARPP